MKGIAFLPRYYVIVSICENAESFLALEETQSKPTGFTFLTEKFAFGSRRQVDALQVEGSETGAVTHQQVSDPLTHLQPTEK